MANELVERLREMADKDAESLSELLKQYPELAHLHHQWQTQIADIRDAVAILERMPVDRNGESLLPGDYVSGDIGGPGVIVSIMRDSLRVVTAGGVFCQLPGNVIKEQGEGEQGNGDD